VPAKATLDPRLEAAVRRLYACQKLHDPVCITEAEIEVGRAAAATGDSNGALYRLERALRRAQELRKVDLEAKATIAISDLPSPPRAEARLPLLERAVDLARGAGDEATLALAQAARGELLLARNRIPDSLAPLDEAARLATKLNLSSIRLRASAALARARSAGGRPLDALDELARAFEIARSEELFEGSISIALLQSSIELDIGRVRAAGASALTAAEIARRAAIPRREAEARRIAAEAAASALDFDRARAELATARAISASIGDAAAEASATVVLAEVELAAGQTAEAERILGEIDEGLLPLFDPEVVSRLFAARSRAAELAGDMLRAEREIRRAAGAAEVSNDPLLEAALRGRSAAIGRTLGRFEDAVVDLRRALTLVRRSGEAAAVWWYESELAETLFRSGFRRQAELSLDTSIAEMTRPGLRLGAARTDRLFPPDARVAAARAVRHRLEKGDAEGALAAAEARAAQLSRLRAATAGVPPGGESRVGREIVGRLREALPSDAALLFFLLAEPDSYIFLVEKGGVTAGRLPDRAELEKSLGGAIAALGSRAAFRLALPPLRPLAGHLLGPLASRRKLPHHLVVIADGVLFRFPFEALPFGPRVEGEIRLVLHSSTVESATSASAWLAARSAPPPRGGAPASLDDSPPDPSGQFPLQDREVLRPLARHPLLLAGTEGTLPRLRAASSGPFSLLLFRGAARLDPAAAEDGLLPIGDGTGKPSRLAACARERVDAELLLLGNLAPLPPGADPSGAFATLVDTLSAIGGRGVLLPAWSLPREDRLAFERAFARRLASGVPVNDALAESRRALFAISGETGPASWAAFRFVGDGSRRLQPGRRIEEIAAKVGAILAIAVASFLFLRHHLRGRVPFPSSSEPEREAGFSPESIGVFEERRRPDGSPDESREPDGGAAASDGDIPDSTPTEPEDERTSAAEKRESTD
jgi:tetratricopeptide (TPR) repeat protein